MTYTEVCDALCKLVPPPAAMIVEVHAWRHGGCTRRDVSWICWSDGLPNMPSIHATTGESLVAAVQAALEESTALMDAIGCPDEAVLSEVRKP